MWLLQWRAAVDAVWQEVVDFTNSGSGVLCGRWSDLVISVAGLGQAGPAAWAVGATGVLEFWPMGREQCLGGALL